MSLAARKSSRARGSEAEIDAKVEVEAPVEDRMANEMCCIHCQEPIPSNKARNKCEMGGFCERAPTAVIPDQKSTAAPHPFSLLALAQGCILKSNAAAARLRQLLSWHPLGNEDMPV